MKGVPVVALARQNVCSRGLVAPRLVSLVLLIVITATLAAIHSEASLKQPKSSSPTSAPSISTIQFEGSPLSVRTFLLGSDQIDSSSFENAVGQQRQYNFNHNNANSHVAPVERNNLQHQVQKSPQSKTNEASIQFSHSKPHSRTAGSDLSTSQSDVFDSNNEEPRISETNLEDLDQQLKASLPPEMDYGYTQLLGALGGGPVEVSAADSLKESTELLHEGEQNLIGRRFGIFKKGHQTSNNNSPYSNLAPMPFYNDYCDRCLSSNSYALNGAAWRIEPTIKQLQHQQQQPYIYPLKTYNEAPIINQFGSSFKNKLSKLHFSKPLKGDSYSGRNYQTGNIYRTPVLNRIPLRLHNQLVQNHQFNCMPTMMGQIGDGANIL